MLNDLVFDFRTAADEFAQALLLVVAEVGAAQVSHKVLPKELRNSNLQLLGSRVCNDCDLLIKASNFLLILRRQLIAFVGPAGARL